MRLSLSVLLIGSLSGPVLAQLPDPGSGLSDRPSAEPLDLPEYAPAVPAPGLQLPPVPREGAPPPAEGPRFQVRGFRFLGHTVYSDEVLQAIAAPFVGRPITLADLEELRHRLTLQYVKNGYVNSGALLPDQRVTDGIITYRIIEGELSEIRIEGTGRLRPEYVRDRLGLGAGPPLNTEDLQERFQLLLSDPLIERLNGTLGPGPELGKSALDVAVTRAKPYSLSVFIDNYRPPSTGAEEIRLDGLVRNLTGYGDLWDLSLQFRDRGTDINTGFAIPVTASDTTLWCRYIKGDASVVEEPLIDLDIESDSQSFECGIRRPLYRTLSRTVTLGALLAVRENENFLLDEPFSFSLGEEDGKSKVSPLRLFQEFVARDRKQVFTARSTFSIGLDAFGATIHDDRLPDGRYLAWLGQGQYARRVLPNGAQLVLKGVVQLANDNLLPLERIAIGGVYTVRGYRENTLVRDNGYAGSIEFRYPLGMGTSWGRFQLVPFMDYGYAWNKGKQSEGEQLHSIGVGLLWSLAPRLSAELYVAHSFEDVLEIQDHNLQDDGIHFRLTAVAF